MSKLDNLYKRLENLCLQRESVEEQIRAEATRLAKTVTVDRRKASTILTNKMGRSIVIGKKNTYGEVKIWEYNGKRGKLLTDGVRDSLYRIKISLADGEFK